MTQFYDKIIYTGNGTKDLDNKELEPKLKNVLWIYKRSDIPKSNAFSFNIWNNGAWQDIIAQQYINEQDIKDLTEKVDQLEEDVRDCETKVDYCEGLITECSKFKSSDASNIMIDTTLTGTQLNGLKMNDALNKILFKEEEPAIVEQQTLEVEYDPYVELGTNVTDFFNSIKIKQKEKLVYNYGCKSFTGNKANSVEKNVDLYGECTLTNIIVSSNKLTTSGTFSLVYGIEDAGYSVCSRKGVVPEDNHPVGELTKQLNNLKYEVYIPFYYKFLNGDDFQKYYKLRDTTSYIDDRKLNKLKTLTDINKGVIPDDYCYYFALFVPYYYISKYNFSLYVNGIKLCFDHTLSSTLGQNYGKHNIYNINTNTVATYALFYIGETYFSNENIDYKLIINSK